MYHKVYLGRSQGLDGLIYLIKVAVRSSAFYINTLPRLKLKNNEFLVFRFFLPNKPSSQHSRLDLVFRVEKLTTNSGQEARETRNLLLGL